ncbi:MAG: Alpha-galactosidase [Microgenomates group bacterium LiPW_16]|nr:MAG: Alpha-galactosidase [Microgenomates group bacterium LiPW_16]
MYWSIFLHIYQPPNQRPEILERIVNESYRPLIKGFLENRRTRLALNINACLTELLSQNGFGDVIEGLTRLAENGQLEFTGSAKYHPFLPLLPKEEIARQIKLNDETNRKYFGNSYQPRGFFPPEMGYDEKVGKVVAQLGFDWIILDEIAFNGKIDQIDFSKIYKIRDLPLKVVFRERRTSNLIMGAMVREVSSVLEALKSEIAKDRYLLTAMDGETFGHHRPGLQNLLFNLFQCKQFEFVKTSDFIKIFPQGGEISPVPCCWASSEEEISKGEPFYLYFRKGNKLHILFKSLLDLAIKVAGNTQGEERILLDRAASCNAFWWANPDAWWSIEEIELGAFNLANVVEKSKMAGRAEKKIARQLYQKIVFFAFTWQRKGLIRRLHAKKQAWIKIPFKKRAKHGEYEAIIEILKKELAKAVARQEFEQAIRWRDSIYKLEHGLDIYSLIHVVDQLRAEGRLGEYARLTEKYKKRYKRIVGGQPE